MEEKNLIIGKTALKQQAKEARELEIYHDYEAAVAAGSFKTDVNRSIMAKYGIKSVGTLYIIRRRVEQRLNQQEQEQQNAYAQ